MKLPEEETVVPAASPLPIKKTITPAEQPELAAAVKEACAAKTPIYSIGGGTSLEYGVPAKREGMGLSLSGLNRVVDYPARDMTITVEAGVTMQALAETLAAERQQLPVDVPQIERATIGGVVATNWNGPRRYGQGTVRDYVIGISAVDGTGRPFKGGGRVVKNVAGYDFCKLLTGSLGTLGIITQLTLRTRPLPERSILVACELAGLDQAEMLLTVLVRSETMPAAIELVGGPAWENDAALAGPPESDSKITSASKLFLIVGLEGTRAEVNWMLGQLTKEWRDRGVKNSKTIVDEAATQLWRRLAEFPAFAEAPLVLKASLAPSGVARFVGTLREVDARCSFQAHAGNGIVIVRFSEFPAGGLSRMLVGKLQPLAAAARGHVQVLSNPSQAEMTHQSVWGGLDAPFELMTAVKREFDPHDILNPGRFVYV
jgi:glycolate oxidase FAD binding subunit